MNKILIIEDDEILNAGLCYNIQKIQLSPVPAYCLQDARQKLREDAFDLIILDVNLPDGSGFDFAKETMPKYSTPYIFLTAHNLEEEIIKGLRLGADDYIVKPFSLPVAMEKIQVVLRRRCGGHKPEAYACGNLQIDFKSRTIMRKGEALALTPTEFEILEALVENRGQVLTKDLLLEKIWDSKGNFVNGHTISLNVSRLRNKIADGEFDYIKTIYGLGYKWSEG